MLLENAQLHVTSCDKTYLPIFVTKQGRFLQASPEINEIHLTITKKMGYDYLHDLKQSEHESFDNDLLYTHEEGNAFNHLLHLRRTRGPG